MMDKEINREELRELIFGLCAIPTVSGYGGHVGEAVASRIGSLFDEVRGDAVGSVVLIKRCGRADAPRLLVDAHLDEIGLMVREVLEGGFLRVASVGGMDPAVLQSADVTVYGKETLRGVICSTPPHLRKGDGKTLPEVSEMMVDVGLGYTKEELEELIPVGTAVGFAPSYRALAGDRIAGKSFDDKACAACAAYGIGYTDRAQLAGDVYLLLSRYEETSRLGGVAPAVMGIAPDCAMIVDVNLGSTADAPALETVDMEKGISVSLSSATDVKLTADVRALCDKEEIPYTVSVSPSSTGTNAPTVQILGESIPTVDVGLPLQSMHTPCEVISLQDCEALVRLVSAFVCFKEIAASCAEKEVVLK